MFEASIFHDSQFSGVIDRSGLQNSSKFAVRRRAIKLKVQQRRERVQVPASSK